MTQTIYIDDEAGLDSVIDGVGDQLYHMDYTPLLEAELSRMSQEHRTYFATQTGPNGDSWAPNKESTIKKKGHSLILRGERKNHFRLSQSLMYEGAHSVGDAIREAWSTGSGSYLVFGTEVPYSIYNSNRPHVGLGRDYVEKMVEAVADFIVRELAR